MIFKIFLVEVFDLLARTIILAAGGTGGHVFPAQALAESLLLRGWKVFLVTDKRGEDFATAFPENVQKLVMTLNIIVQ